MKITVNGKVYDVPDGASISVTDGAVTVNGQKVPNGVKQEIKITVEGGLANLRTEVGSVTVHGNVGHVSADGSVTVDGKVEGDVNCGGSVTCGDVGKDVKAGGSVKCGKVGGNVKAGGSVSRG